MKPITGTIVYDKPTDDKSTDLEMVDQLVQWLDTKFVIPGLGIRFGLDAIIGLIPGFGDAVTSLLSFYILSVANRYNVPRVTQARMAANIALDWLVGLVPIVGDLFDIAWKANSRNAVLLKRHMSPTASEQHQHRKQDWMFLGLLAVVLLGVLAFVLFAAFWMFGQIWHMFAG